MKCLFCFIALLMFNYSMNGQEKIDRFTINFGLTLPVYNSSFSGHELTLVPEVEFLLNLPLYKTIQLSAGIGIESGKHKVVEHVAYLAWRNDVKEWWPYRGVNYWNLDFFSMKVPVYVSVPLNNFFFRFLHIWLWFGMVIEL